MNFFLLISLLFAAPLIPSPQVLSGLAQDALKPSVGRAIGWASLAAVGGAAIGTGSIIIRAKRQEKQQKVSAAGL
jgi:hypothetical protein